MMTFIFKLYTFIRKFAKSVSDDNISAFSGESTLFIIISFFPFSMLMLTLVKYTPLTEDSVITLISKVIPPGTSNVLIPIIEDIYQGSSFTLLSISAVTLMWSASRGLMSLVRGFNEVYRTAETRGYVRLRISSLIYTLGFALLIILSLLVLVFGNKLYLLITKLVPQINNLAVLIISVRAIFLTGLFLFYFLVVYIFLPNRKSSILYELPGAVIASAGWLLFSYLYSFYINNISMSSTMYGSLSTIVFLMIWLYFCIYILFIGAKVNDLLRNVIEYHLGRRKHF